MRLLMVLPVVQLLLTGHYLLAFGLAVVAEITDGLDGYLARRFDSRTALGAFLDPLADKVMMVSLYLTLGVMELLPYWIIAVIIGRDLYIILGTALFRLYHGSIAFTPTLSGKLSTVLQMLLLAWTLGMLAFEYQRPWTEQVQFVLIWSVLIVAIISAASYWKLGIQRSDEQQPS